MRVLRAHTAFGTLVQQSICALHSYIGKLPLLLVAWECCPPACRRHGYMHACYSRQAAGNKRTNEKLFKSAGMNKNEPINSISRTKQQLHDNMDGM